MANSNGIITAPVSIYDLQSVVPVTLRRTNSSTGQVETKSSNDLGVLCSKDIGATIPASDGHGSWTVISRVPIKTWAKFKPVNIGGTYGGSTYINTYPLLNPTTKQWDESLSFQWWRDTNRHNNLSRYGILPVIATTAQNLYNAYANGDEWIYYMPMGGSDYPYRILDFNQYNHNAPTPAGMEIGNFTKNITGSWSLSFALPSSQDDADPITQRDYVVPKDILRALWGSDNNKPYYGIMIYNPRDSSICAVVTSDTISGTDTMINGINVLEYDKDYYIIPFYSNQQISLGRLLGGATLAAIPNSSMGIMHTSQSGTQEYGRYILKAVFPSNTGRLVVNTAISTETYAGVQYSSHTFQNVTMYVCEPSTTAPATGAPASYIDKVEYGNIFIDANSRWDAATYDSRPTQNSVTCYLYEDGKKRATASAIKPDPVEPPTPIGL